MISLVGSQMDPAAMEHLITAKVELQVPQRTTTASINAKEVNQEEIKTRMEDNQERMEAMSRSGKKQLTAKIKTGWKKQEPNSRSAKR
jgi:hypothetical protein